MLIPSSVLAIHRVCAADTTRYPGILGVRFEREPDGGCLAVATDRVRLLVCRWREPETAPGFLEPMARVAGFAVTVPAAAAKLIEREAVKLKLYGRAWAALDESVAAPRCELTLALPHRHPTLEGAYLSVNCRALEGAYPSWREVAAGIDARAGEPDGPLDLDPLKLAGLLEAAGLAVGDDPESYRLGFGPGKGKKIRVEQVSGDELVTVTGYMMPLAAEALQSVGADGGD